ncbi:aspartyl-phosphate phosphatase Spo0E family protein [Desulfosporosinus acidiphilus]|uniref:aspartyl-phosphate phosphatase Spo0E family protein n=1 Tax=Desulfosporosinus acidiphilus TaxID=885581 RepID=UPI0009FD837E|nr:aspartyl-phosphate phosphatase Spo0E family protein [Desulfosporosinus acidiphilus]
MLQLKVSVIIRIEELRLQMHKIASNRDLTDSKVLNVSERLDELINEFYSRKKCELKN